jgi:crotonobetainyl-CoA:carnitine CoA-transferase CaiB-like acyl-CoA transferase
MAELTNGPLSAVRVPGLSSIFMGPFATRMLGIWGPRSSRKGR